MANDIFRPRLILVTTPLADETAAAALEAALSGGDVASVIIDGAGRDPDAFQAFAEPLVAIAQAAGAAALVVDDTRCAGRTRADGVHLSDGDPQALADAIERYTPGQIVGGSGFETRHVAMQAGEAMPDYLFFGRLAGDTADAPHPKTLSLAGWWADIMEIPCVALAGNDVESTAAAAETGAEFVALASAVFAPGGDPAAAVARANAILDGFEREDAA